MNQSIEEIQNRIRGFDVEIRKTEILIDGAARILEEVRAERKTLRQRVERMRLEDAVEYPSFFMN